MLNKIIENKKKEIEINKKKLPLPSFKNKLSSSKRDFRKAISKNRVSIIAEFKRKSPCKNIIEKQFNMQTIINIYNRYADAISILTDANFFSGSLKDMKNVSKLTHLPILRKDFIIDEYQIYEARLYNADAILLIASILSKNEINNFIRITKKYNMHCLVEVHTEEELNKVLNTKAQIIGINNRNLNTLKIDLETTLRIADKIPSDKIIVSESGIQNRNYVEKIKNKVNAIIIGTLFMNSLNLEENMEKISSQNEIFCNQNDKNKNMWNNEL